MQSIKSISIIGSGNIANHLGVEFYKLGFNIEFVFSRNGIEGKKLAKKLNAQYLSIGEINCEKSSHLLLIAISDDSIEALLSKIDKTEIIIAHTSGSVSSTVFSNKFNNYGVLYPLQTFTKNTILDFKQIPFFVFGSNKLVEKKLIELSNVLSEMVEIMDDLKRQKLHIAAIIANNFSNHLFALSEQYCKENDLDFEQLKPLIAATFKKINNNISPFNAQTGPASRGDMNTIMNHLNTLKDSKIKHFESIYTLLSASILNLHTQPKG